MSLRDELTALHRENGRLTAQLVVDAARPVGHPLHDRFEWNDAVAGEKYRRTQAAELIRSVKVEWATGSVTTEPVRAFHSITRADSTSYEPIEDIATDDLAAQLLLRQAVRDWKALHRRYQHLDGFLRAVKSDIESDVEGVA